MLGLTNCSQMLPILIMLSGSGERNRKTFLKYKKLRFQIFRNSDM